MCRTHIHKLTMYRWQMEIMDTGCYFGKSPFLRNVSAPRDSHLSLKLYSGGCLAKFQLELKSRRQVPYFQARFWS